MSSEFQEKLKNLRAEVLQLKTAAPFSAVKPASYASYRISDGGTYTITYANDDTPIFSLVGVSQIPGGLAFAKTPTGNTQEVYVSMGEGQDYVDVQIVSNRRIVGFG